MYSAETSKNKAVIQVSEDHVGAEKISSFRKHYSFHSLINPSKNKNKNFETHLWLKDKYPLKFRKHEYKNAKLHQFKTNS